MARAGRRRRRHARAASASERRPGVTTAELDAARRGLHPRAGRRADFKGYRGYPASICISPNAWSCTGSRGMYALRRGRHPLGRRRRHARRLRRRLAPTRSRSARSRPRPSACSTSARTRSLPESSSARAATTSPTSRTRSRASTEGEGFSVVRSLVGHGVGRADHEDPQIPNFGAPGRGPVLRAGMTFAIEPMINAGGAGRRHARRRVVDLVRRRLALGALRAHGRGDRGRPAHPDRRPREECDT